MESGLQGRGVLITGGSGGIGKAVCRLFASEGARVVVHYHRAARVARELAAEIGGLAIAADLRREEQAAELVRRSASDLGRLDVCVANAGIWPRADQPLWELPADRWLATIESNLTATAWTAKAFLGHVATTGAGALVLVGSTAGRFGEAGHADYAAAKGAIQTGLLLSLKNEAARLGAAVRVNAVAPGWTATPMSAEALADPAQVAHATSTMALAKVATPEDIAAAIVWLASDRLAGHVSGELVTVSGGMEGRLLRPPA